MLSSARCATAAMAKGGVLALAALTLPLYCNLDTQQFLAIRIDEVHRTGEARIEAMDRPQDLERLLRIVQALPPQRRLIRTVDAGGIPWTSIPGAGHHRLIV